MIMTQKKGKIWGARLQVPDASVSYRTATRDGGGFVAGWKAWEKQTEQVTEVHSTYK